MMGKNSKVVFGLPKGWEWFALMVMVFSLFGLFQASNLYLRVGESWMTHFSGSLTFKGSIAFWTLSATFIMATMFVTARSLLVTKKRQTFNGYDATAGLLTVLGVFFVIIGTLYGVFKGEEHIEFLYNIRFLLLLQFGWLLTAFGCVWFAVTE
jgi:hypothetical protein